MDADSHPSMTEAEYLEYDRTHEGKHEYVNGELVAMFGVTSAHDAIQMNLSIGIGYRLRGTPCRPHGPDLRVRIDETGLYAYPDLSVHCGAAEFAPTNPETLLNPKVIVEVLSKSTETYDRGAKASHYRHRASMEAVLLVDSRRRLVEVQTRNADGSWLLTEVTTGDLRIAALGVAIPLDEIYEGVEGLASATG